MSLIDKINARPENSGRAPIKGTPTTPEVTKEEIEALNAELDSESEVEVKAEVEGEVELSPAELAARTKDSYEDEIKKLREENAKRRKKEQEAKEKALAMADEVFKTEREDYDSQLAEMKKQLEALKSLKKEESKVDKEVKEAESKAESDVLRTELAAIRKENATIQAQIQAQKDAEEQEKSLRKQAAENRFGSMLKEIPEEFKEAASAMFKGYTDPSEGLLAITKYKAQGLFGKKTIEVVNRVPTEQKNNNENQVLTSREKFQRKTKAISERRQGLTPGSRIVQLGNFKET